jgi:hypothetical protein
MKLALYAWKDTTKFCEKQGPISAVTSSQTAPHGRTVSGEDV